jgi:hypothetical protein
MLDPAENTQLVQKAQRYKYWPKILEKNVLKKKGFSLVS